MLLKEDKLLKFTYFDGKKDLECHSYMDKDF